MRARPGSVLRSLSSLPLIQSGLSLVMSSVLSSALGFVFWILAARRFTPADLGVGSAVITTMLMLSDVGHLGLRTGLVRFLPTSGRGARDLIARSYLLAMGVAGAGALIFVLGLGWWLPGLHVLRSWGYGSFFVVATAFWVVFQLEDSALIGLRLAPWVPVENGLFGLFKILLLFLLGGLTGAAVQLGVFLAWSLPVFVIVISVTAALARATRDGAPGPPPAPAPTVHVDAPGPDRIKPVGGGPARLRRGRAWFRGEVLPYSLVDWGATVTRGAVIGLLPLLVLSLRGAEVAAFYTIAWTITFSVYFLSATVADAVLAEASYDEANLDRHTLHGGLLSMAISAPVVLVAVVVAPWVLRAFGPEYAAGAATTLRLLLLGSIPNVVARTYVGRLRASRRMRAVLVFEGALSAGVLVLGWLLLSLAGIAGLGAAWLVALTGAALYVLAVESVAWWAPRLGPEWSRRLVHLQAEAERRRHQLPQPGRDRAVRELLASRYATRPSWRRLSATPHTQTIRVAGHEGRPPLVMELATSPWGVEVLSRRVAAVSALAGMTGLPSFRALVPFPIEHHTEAGREFLIESALSGRPGAELARGGPAEPWVAAVEAAIGDLHRATTGWLTFDRAQLDRWVSQPLRTLGEAAGVPAERLVPLGRRLCDALEGQLVPSARLHGDLGLHTARFDGQGRLTGLVDWEWSDTGPAFLDWCSLALSSVAVCSDEDIGAATLRCLEDPDVLRTQPALANHTLPEIDGVALVLFTWLHAVVPALRRAPSGGPNRYWLIRNVTAVLAWEGRSALPSR